MQVQGRTSEGAAVGAAADVAGAFAQARVEALAEVAHQQHPPATQLLLAILDLNSTWGVCHLERRSSVHAFANASMRQRHCVDRSHDAWQPMVRTPHHGVQGVQVALQLRRQAARLLRALTQHVARLLRVRIRVIHDTARGAAVPPCTTRLLLGDTLLFSCPHAGQATTFASPGSSHELQHTVYLVIALQRLRHCVVVHKADVCFVDACTDSASSVRPGRSAQGSKSAGVLTGRICGAHPCRRRW